MRAVVTRWHRFAGANIKGTPSMSAEKVSEDVELLRRNASVLVLQEFRWPWYWRQLKKVLQRVRAGDVWRSAPGMARGLAAPVLGAQSVAWRSRYWKRRRVEVLKLHDGAAGISEDRYLRAALLEEREAELCAWFGTTHFVVGGDERTDGPLRKAILEHDLQRLARFLRQLKATGHPIVMQADLNIHPGTWAYVELMQILDDLGARLVGVHGVEYLIVLDGADVDVEVRRTWEISPRRLNTDHEVRGMTFRLVRRVAA